MVRIYRTPMITANLSQLMSDAYDYIIVGSGSAGCVLANRLSANPNTKVLLIEYGGSDNSMFIKMPSAFSIPLNTKKYDWRFFTEPEPHLNNRRLHQAKGKVLGGSSSTNGMIFVRGNASDFDGWEQEGAKGWSYKDVLPYFKKMETFDKCANPAYRGSNGPLTVTKGNWYTPLFKAFTVAGHQAGHPITEDYNGASQEGFFHKQMTIRNGVRCSTALAYINDIKDRKNLTILLNTFVTRVVFEGKKAVGVNISLKGKQKTIYAKEVILSAGAIMSPKLLLLSGVGDKNELQKIGIDVVQDLPGVGKNLQDHLEVYLQYQCKKPVSLYKYMNIWGKAYIGIRWLLFKSGLGATNHFEAGAFLKSSADKPYPNLQFHFLPLAISYDGKKSLKAHGFQVHLSANLSESRGCVQLNSKDPFADPKISFNYMSCEEDWVDIRNAVRITRKIFTQEAMKDFLLKEIQPGEQAQTDEQIDDFFRNKSESAIHASCTCKMGEDEMAVVDNVGRVHNISNLRVVDSSIMPRITNGNLNAPTIMLAEKIADSMI